MIHFLGGTTDFALGSHPENRSRQDVGVGVALAEGENYPRARFARLHPPRFG